MNAALALLIGGAFGFGAVLVVRGLHLTPTHHSRVGVAWPADMRSRLVRAGVGAVLGGVVTRWPVAAVAGAALGFFARDLLGARSAHGEVTARSEAIAGWAEMIRDTLAGAHGLEEAIVTTAPLAPAAIRPQVAALADRLRQEPLSEVLPDFAAALAHPTGDLVTAALSMAAAGGVRDVARLLSALAASARAEAAMQQRIEANRARTRTSVRTVAACTAIAVVGLVAFKRPYLAPYATGQGQVVLTVVCLAFAGGLAWLAKLADYGQPERFLVRRSGGRQP